MGDHRQPDLSNTSKPEDSNGIERASNLLFDQFLQGDFNVRRNSNALLTEACQLNTLTLTDTKEETDLAVRTNLYTLATAGEFRSPELRASFNFTPEHGWNNPFQRPTYNLEALTADRRSILSVASRNGAAPDVKFRTAIETLTVNYMRDSDRNELAVSADGGPKIPIKVDFSHGFRNNATSVGLRSERPNASTWMNVNAMNGIAPTFQFAHRQDGLQVNYLRNSLRNQLSATAEAGVRMPINVNFGYDFRQNSTSFGLGARLSPQSDLKIGTSIGPRNYYDANIRLQIGGKTRTTDGAPPR